MKIAFVPADYLGCGYVRCVQVGFALQERGYSVAFSAHTKSPAFDWADIVVLQRQHLETSLDLLRELKGNGKIVLHDIDDSFHFIPESNPNAQHFNSGRKNTKIFEQICREADALILSTPSLQEFYQRFNPRAYLCYNAIDDKQAEKHVPTITGQPKREGQIRIGYAGSGTHHADFSLVLPSLLRVMNEHPEVRIIFVGADMRAMIPLALRHRAEFTGQTADARDPSPQQLRDKSSLATPRYYDLIAKSDFDIGIAPLESTRFNSDKSYLKAMEMGFLGIPLIASRHTPYRQYQASSDDIVCLLVDGPKEWHKALVSLITSSERRAALAESNLEYVHREHLISKKIEQWDIALQEIVRLKNLQIREKMAV